VKSIPLWIGALLVSGIGSVASADAPSGSVWDRLSLYANGRVRAESDMRRPNAPDRFRGRLRFRLGGKYAVTNAVSAEVRLTSTSGDPNNPHWDFAGGDDGLDGSEVALDRIFLKWAAHDQLDLQAGQFPHAFQGPPVMGEFVWDADFHPAGVAAIVGPGKKDGASFDLRGIAYVAKQNSNDSDPLAMGGQGNLYFDAGASTDVQLSSSVIRWSRLEESGGFPGNQGNSDPLAEILAVEGFLSVDHRGGPWQRTTAFVQGMHNPDDDTGEDTGLAAGIQVGPTGKKGNCSAFGVFYDFDANCMLSAPAQDDTPFAGTGIGEGMDGFFGGVQYWVADNLSIRAWGITSNAGASENPVRLRLDVDFVVR
jgi:hypothetical protein